MSIIGIVAVDRNGAIGKGGAIPWRYAADMKFFREQTLHHACVMGYKTWLSLKKPLRDRLNIVLSRKATVEPQTGVINLNDKRAVLSLQPYLSCDLFIIGGEQIYRTFLAEIDRWIVTEVPLAVADADAFVPADFLRGFTQVESEQLEDDLKVTFYRKDSPAPTN